ncbi:MAG TPA: methyltransferase domain-containing protein [Stellaceae bacterium]|nr:methyltransferase domain-containing protein [Stellaceae bacterium]
MFVDVVDLRDFYATRLGQVARRQVRARIRQVWPDVTGMRVLGLGYATPYLRPFVGEAERVFALMPAGQGVLPWPEQESNLVALTDESELPLQDYSIDRVLLTHGLEFSERSRALLTEVWRVLAGGGRLLVLVPNRRGLWSVNSSTPFGQGNPYSSNQLARLLRDAQFTPERTEAALFVPPATRSRMLLGSAGALERIGARWFNRFGGVVMIEATKQLYRPAAERAEKRRAVYVPANAPLVPGR